MLLPTKTIDLYYCFPFPGPPSQYCAANTWLIQYPLLARDLLLFSCRNLAERQLLKMTEVLRRGVPGMKSVKDLPAVQVFRVPSAVYNWGGIWGFGSSGEFTCSALTMQCSREMRMP